jgi:hypothetical protein
MSRVARPAGTRAKTKGERRDDDDPDEQPAKKQKPNTGQHLFSKVCLAGARDSQK